MRAGATPRSCGAGILPELRRGEAALPSVRAKRPRHKKHDPEAV
jgi:hypothetical protein